MKHLIRIGFTAILALTLVIALSLGSTAAFALGIKRSPTYAAIQTAREALTAQYRLTPEMIALFQIQAQESDGAWSVSFSTSGSETIDAQAVGEYAVTISPDGKASAHWSHDDADPSAWQTLGLDSTIWGAPQIGLALAQYAAYQTASNGGEWTRYTELSMAEQVKLYDALAAIIAPKPLNSHAVMPRAEDIQPEEAIRDAKEEIVKTYGIQPDRLEALKAQVSLNQNIDEAEPCYQIVFSDTPQSTQQFYVSMFTPSGKFSECNWHVSDPALRTLPEGDLTGYEQAVTEYLEDGSFALLDAAHQADVAHRIVGAGMGNVLPMQNYTAPAPGELEDAAALAAAKKALESSFHLTDAMLSLFEAHASLTEQNGARQWMITFTPLIDPYGKVLDWRWRDQLAMCLGDYSVTLNALSGEATSADWTLASMADDNAYMENTWGQAQAYGVKILPWVQALLKKTRPIIDRYPESDVLWFSIEDAAAYDQAFRDAGFDASLHDHALPQTGDVPYDQALSLAKEVFTSDCGMSDASFGAYTKTIEYTAQETKLWQIRYYNANYMYTVILDAKTGEVQLAELTNSAAGNG